MKNLTSSPTPKSSARPSRRGAPLGNRNALKHGFYARCFRRPDLGDLQSHVAEGLQDEISLLRVTIRRIVELAQEADTLDDKLRAYSVMTAAIARLAGLQRTQYVVFLPRSEIEKNL